MQVQTVWKAGSERQDWRLFLLQTCLTLAILLLGGALICWVAANWAGWSRFERLTGTQVALAIVALGAIILLWRTRMQANRARSVTGGLLGLACVALGALLALVGQTYQTGADTWELFAVWAALMLPWAVAGRSASIWLLWVVVVNTALLLGSGPDSVREQWSRLADSPLWMLPFNLAALAGWTAWATGDPAHRRTGPRVLAALALMAATLVFLNDTDLLGAGALLWVWTVVPLALIYQRARPDGVVLAMLVLSGIAASVRLVWLPFDDFDWEGRVVMTIAVTMTGGVLGHRWIRHALQAQSEHARHTTAPDAARVPALALLGAAMACAALVWAAPLIEQTTSTTFIVVGLVTLGTLALWMYVTNRGLAQNAIRNPATRAPLQAAMPDARPQGTTPAPLLAETAAYGPSATPPPAEDPPHDASRIASAVLLAMTAWFSAALLVGTIAIVGLWDPELSISVASPLFALVGVLLVRGDARSLFLKQIGSALAFAGLLMLTIQAVAFGEPGWSGALRLTVISLAVYALSGYATLQFLAALIVAVGLTLITWLLPTNRVDIFQAASALFDGPGVHALGAWTPVSFGLAALAMVLFLSARRTTAGRSRVDPIPMAWGMALAALTCAWVSAGVPVTQLGNLWALHAPTALVLAFGAVLPSVASIAVMWPLRAVLPVRMRLGVPAGLLALGVLWLPSPGIVFALTWTLLGFGLRRRGLLALGSLSLIAYLCVYYYQLGVPLLDKALWLGQAGVVAAVLGLVLWRAHRQAAGALGLHSQPARAGDTIPPGSTDRLPPGSQTRTATPRTAWRPALALAGFLLVLAAVNTTIWQREQLIAHGREVLLALAPVDPRSLMQGDYMRLDFVLSRDIREQIDATPQTAPVSQGYAILSLDPTGQARLLRVQDTPRTANENEIALQYREREGQIKVVTNAWFFPEGQADHFAQARYGVLRVDATGRALLVQMRDSDFKPL